MLSLRKLICDDYLYFIFLIFEMFICLLKWEKIIVMTAGKVVFNFAFSEKKLYTFYQLKKLI